MEEFNKTINEELAKRAVKRREESIEYNKELTDKFGVFYDILIRAFPRIKEEYIEWTTLQEKYDSFEYRYFTSNRLFTIINTPLTRENYAYAFLYNPLLSEEINEFFKIIIKRLLDAKELLNIYIKQQLGDDYSIEICTDNCELSINLNIKKVYYYE